MRHAAIFGTMMLAALAAAPAYAQMDNGRASTRQFVHDMAVSDMYERQAGQIALDQARSPRVKDFARMMTRAHRYTSRNLQAALENSGRQIPIPDSLDSRHEEMLDRLQNARDFDRAYIRQQERAHRQALALVRDYRENGRDPALRRVAAQTEPVIERHLAMLDRIDRRG